MSHSRDDDVTSRLMADGSDSGACSISLSSQGSGRMSSLRDLTRSPTPHSISGISLNSSGPVVHKSARLARSPVTVKSSPSKLHDVSDGIRPPTTKAFEKNISSCRDHLAEENKDDYTRWVNHFCPDLVKEDIVAELSDGVKLLALFNVLTGNKLRPEKGCTVHHQTLNVEKVFTCLEDQFQVDVSSLNASDVVRGRREAVLAVVWTLILNFSDEEIRDFDGLRAFLLQAEANRREADVLSTSESLSHEVGSFPHLFPDDGNVYQKIKSSLFCPKPEPSLRQRSTSSVNNELPPDQPDSHLQSKESAFYKSGDTTDSDLQPDDLVLDPPLKPILKPTPQFMVTSPETETSEPFRGRTVRQRMFEVKEKSRVNLLRNQQHLSFTKKQKKERPRSPKQVEDQNRNLHLVHPVDELVLESNQIRNEGKESAEFPTSSTLSSIWKESTVRNALRVVLPIQVLMLMVVGMSFLVPSLEEINCFDCLKENNYIREFGPVFYHPFPPAI